MNSKHVGIFFDGDDTINTQNGFVREPSELALRQRSVAVIRETIRAVRKVFFVKNESGITRGILGEDNLAAVRLRLSDLLKKRHPQVNAIYRSPHYPEHGNPSSNVPHQCLPADFGVLKNAVVQYNVLQMKSCIVDSVNGDWLKSMNMMDHQKTPVA